MATATAGQAWGGPHTRRGSRARGAVARRRGHEGSRAPALRVGRPAPGWGSPPATAQTMGKMFKIYLCGDRVYSCSTCRTHLAKHDQIVSKVSPRSCVRACAGMARVCSTRGPRGAKWYPAHLTRTRVLLYRPFRADTAVPSCSAMCTLPPPAPPRTLCPPAARAAPCSHALGTRCAEWCRGAIRVCAQRQHFHGRQGGPKPHYRPAHGRRRLLQLVPDRLRLEIRELPVARQRATQSLCSARAAPRRARISVIALRLADARVHSPCGPQTKPTPHRE